PSVLARNLGSRAALKSHRFSRPRSFASALRMTVFDDATRQKTGTGAIYFRARGGARDPHLARKNPRRPGVFVAADFWSCDAHALSDSLVVLLQLHRLSDDFASRRAG